MNGADLEEYSIPLHKIFTWLKLCIEIRHEDIRIRKKLREKAIVDREKAIEGEERRKRRRQNFHDIELKKFDEAKAKRDANDSVELDENDQPMPETFNSTNFYFKFDNEHPPITIPDEIGEDVDNDYFSPKVEEEEDEYDEEEEQVGEQPE